MFIFMHLNMVQIVMSIKERKKENLTENCIFNYFVFYGKYKSQLKSS